MGDASDGDMVEDADVGSMGESPEGSGEMDLDGVGRWEGTSTSPRSAGPCCFACCSRTHVSTSSVDMLPGEEPTRAAQMVMTARFGSGLSLKSTSRRFMARPVSVGKTGILFLKKRWVGEGGEMNARILLASCCCLLAFARRALNQVDTFARV